MRRTYPPDSLRPRRSRAALHLILVAAFIAASLGLPSTASAKSLSQIWYQGPSLPVPFAPRWDAASAPFPPLQKIVLFGGAPAQIGQPWYNDTWIYSDATGAWSQGPAAPAGLKPRGGMAMAYDPAIGKIVLFGGGAPNRWPQYHDTWLFDGTKWTKGPAAPAGLDGRTGARMVYDDAIGKIVMFGGSGVVGYNDTWLFDGTKWTKGPAAPTGMGPRSFFGMTYDPVLGKVVVAGGNGGTDVWYFNGLNWKPGPSLPSTMVTRERTRLVYDPHLGGDVMFGGIGPAPQNTSLWLLSGGAWSLVPFHPNPKPKARIDPQILWDPTKEQFFVFAGVQGGSNGKNALSDLWFVLSPPMVVAPTSGPKGTRVSITSGPGWLPGVVVSVLFQKQQLGTATADSLGYVRTRATVPAKSSAGVKTFKLSNQTLDISEQATFTVTGLSGEPGGGAGHSTGAGPPAEPAPPASAAVHYAATPVPASGQVTAHDGRFWLGSSPILLHGIDASPIEHTYMAEPDYAQIASWNMNLVRMRVHWGDIESKAPTKNVDGTWTHYWDAYDIQALKDQISWAADHGEYVVIENSRTSDYPPWLFTAGYNSHAQDYVDMPSFNADYWSDAMMQQFTRAYLKYLVGQLAPLRGIIGYEPIDEAEPGTLPQNHDTTQLLLDVQYTLAKAVRAVDPPRAIFFTTRETLGAGLPSADLSKWVKLGNVAFDIHDYFGARWGVALDMNPANPLWGETTQALLDFTINPDTPPYLGTSDVHIRFIQLCQSYLTPKGIPLIVGEFGGKAEDEPNINTLFGTMTSAFNYTGVAWAVWGYNGDDSVFTEDGSPEPWVPILAEAAAQR